MLGLLGRRPLSPRLARVTVGLVVVWCLALTSCDTSSLPSLNTTQQNALEFTVSLPASGLVAEGGMSGALNEPAAPITGATISLVP